MKKRAGVILAAVLIGLLAVMMIGGVVSGALVLHHRAAQRAEQNQQAFWLAESATQRALHAVAHSADYRGETWRLDAIQLGGAAGGAAIIRVEPIDEATGARRVVVEASYPENSPGTILHRREVAVYPSSNPGDSS